MNNVARYPVLVLVESDGFISVHADKNVDVHIQRVIKAPRRGSEQLADDVTYMMVPKRYQRLYGVGLRRSMAASKPLLASTALEVIELQRLLDGLNELPGKE